MNLIKMSVGATLVVMLMVGTPASAAVKVTLQEAVEKRMVEVDVNSLGGATGDTIRVEVKRKVPKALHIEVTPGTVFVARNQKVQNMTAGRLKGELIDPRHYRPAEVIVLENDDPHTYLVESYCLDYHKPPPKREDSFSLALDGDRRAVRVLTDRDKTSVDVSLWAAQCAIWIDRTGVTDSELKRRFRKVTDDDLRTARRMVKDAEQRGIEQVPQDIDPAVKVEIERLYSPYPAVRSRGAETLRSMGSRAEVAVPYLVENLVHMSPSVRVWVEALGGRVDVRVADTVKVAVGDVVDVEVGDEIDVNVGEGIRVNVGEGVDVKVGPLRVGELIESIIGEKGEAGPGSAQPIDRWVARLQSDFIVVRRSAATVLGLRQNIRAVEPLIVALEDSDPGVRANAAASLAKLTAQEFGTDRQKWMSWWAENRDELLKDDTPPSPE